MFASTVAVFIAGGAATIGAVAAQGQGASLAFVEPRGIANGALGVRYTAGDHIDIKWTTPFDHTTLTVWEGPFPDGSYMASVLADKWTKDRTHVQWKVTPSTEDSKHGFHFELQKGNQPNDCVGCILNSPKFAILQTPLLPTVTRTSSHTSKTSSHSRTKTTSSNSRTSTTHSRTSTSHSSSTLSSTSSSSTSSSSSSSSSSTRTTSSTATSTTTTASITTTSSSSILPSSTSSTSATRTSIGLADAGTSASATSAPSYMPDSTSGDHGLAVGLAVGFGTGVPIIIAIYAVLLFFYTRAQRRKEAVRLATVEEEDAQRLNEKRELRSATNSWISKFSMASVFTQATSYHETFEFQQPDGSKRPGSERLFRNGEQIPGSPGRFFRR